MVPLKINRRAQEMAAKISPEKVGKPVAEEGGGDLYPSNII